MRSPAPVNCTHVFADDVAGADRGIARRRAPLPGGRAERQCRARRRVDLRGVVGFDDVAVPTRQRRAQRARPDRASTATPRLKLDAQSMAMRRRCRFQRRRIAWIRQAGGARRQAACRGPRTSARIASKPSGRLKSIATSNSGTPCSSVAANRGTPSTTRTSTARDTAATTASAASSAAKSQQGLAHAAIGTMDQQAQGISHPVRLTAAGRLHKQSPGAESARMESPPSRELRSGGSREILQAPGYLVHGIVERCVAFAQHDLALLGHGRKFLGRCHQHADAAAVA